MTWNERKKIRKEIKQNNTERRKERERKKRERKRERKEREGKGSWRGKESMRMRCFLQVRTVCSFSILQTPLEIISFWVNRPRCPCTFCGCQKLLLFHCEIPSVVQSSVCDHRHAEIRAPGISSKIWSGDFWKLYLDPYELASRDRS